MCSSDLALRAASSTAPPNALTTEPPAPITLTRESWDAPVNTNNDIAQAWATVAPAPTASTPNDIPNTTNATPMTSEAETNLRAPGARKWCMSVAGELGLARPVLEEALHADAGVLRAEDLLEEPKFEGEPGREVGVEPLVDRLLHESCSLHGS